MRTILILIFALSAQAVSASEYQSGVILRYEFGAKQSNVVFGSYLNHNDNLEVVPFRTSSCQEGSMGLSGGYDAIPLGIVLVGIAIWGVYKMATSDRDSIEKDYSSCFSEDSLSRF